MASSDGQHESRPAGRGPHRLLDRQERQNFSETLPPEAPEAPLVMMDAWGGSQGIDLASLETTL